MSERNHAAGEFVLTVLHINTTGNVSGAGRSAFRIHTGLKRLGIRSRMLVGRHAVGDEDVHLINRGLRWLDRAFLRLTDALSLQYLFVPSSFLLPWRQWVREADVVQMYNTHGGYFSHLALVRLSRIRPVVWRLSDMWAMTGQCVYSYDCQRWKTGCGACPLLHEPMGLRRDRTAFLWQVKDRVYARCRITVVTPSRWLSELAQQSPLLARFPIVCIPNGLDPNVFRPMDKREARAALGLPADEQVLLFSAHSVAQRRKGGIELKAALGELARTHRSPVTLLLVGERSREFNAGAGFRLVPLDMVSDDTRMATIYSAADVFVLPTLADNLPNGVLESMACATPVVSFVVGGVPEAVRHMETGYLAAYRDTGDLARGIRLLLERPDLRARLGARCREVVEQEFTQELQAQRYKALYETILSPAASCVLADGEPQGAAPSGARFP